MLVGLPPLYSNDRDEMYANIVTKQPSYPQSLSQEAIALLKGLLEKDPTKRLGARHGIEEIKESDFCRGIDWQRMLKKKIKVPLKIDLKS